MIECPKCETEVEVTDIHEEMWVDNDHCCIEYVCHCPNCGFDGRYSELLKVVSREWDNVE